MIIMTIIHTMIMMVCVQVGGRLCQLVMGGNRPHRSHSLFAICIIITVVIIIAVFIVVKNIIFIVVVMGSRRWEVC